MPQIVARQAILAMVTIPRKWAINTAAGALGGARQAIERSRAMMGFNRGIQLTMAVLALCLAGPAGAEENLDSGKTGAQLFASDCVICHKNAASLGRAGGLFGLSGFLREHYTASSQSASIIAAYVESVARSHPPGRRPGATKRTAKGDEKAKAGEKKLGTAKFGKPAAAKMSEPKNSDSKTSESKTSAPRPPELIPSQAKPDAKPAKPEKSD
jgi:mono/diheme cytochrome c family protein